MKRVLEQVQKDIKENLDKNESYQKAKKDFQDQGGEENAKALAEKAAKKQEELKKLRDAMSEKTSKTGEQTSNYMKLMREQAQKHQEKLKQQAEEAKKKLAEEKEEDSEFVKNMKSGLGKLGENLEKSGISSDKIGGKLKGVFGAGLDRMQSAVKGFEGDKASSHTAWKEQKENLKKYKESKEYKEKEARKAATGAAGSAEGEAEADKMKAESADGSKTESSDSKTDSEGSTESEADAARAKAAASEEPNALVVKEQSAWDRFGASMSDMPLLGSVLENPLFDRLFSVS